MTLKAFVIETAKYLHETGGFDITFICSDDPDFARSLPEYIHYIPVPMKRGVSLGGIGAMLKMRRIFRKEDFDLVQYSTPNASLYAALAARLARIPVRLYCQWGIAYVGMHGIKRRIFRSVEKFVCKLSTHIEPDSFGNLDFCRKEGLYPVAKSSVIWNGSASGVNLEKFDVSQKSVWRDAVRKRHQLPDTAFVFGFIGRVKRDKGVNELFSAFKNILKIRPDSYLMMVGIDEADKLVDPELYHWAKSEPQVLFCGFIDEVEQYLSAMDVYVLPSYREGFGSAVIEAEAMCVPVIVSRIPGPTDAMIPDETGLTVACGNPYELEQAMLKLHDDSAMRQSFGEAARDLAVRKFDQKQLLVHILNDRKRLMGL